jgi:hypothetical protein
VERSGRDEPMRVAIHKCMVTILAIFLDSYLYLKLAKTLYFSIIFYVFSSAKLENKKEEQILTRSRGRGRRIMYTYVSECKNNKIKQNKIKQICAESPEPVG